MRVLMIAEPGLVGPPPEMVLPLLEAFKAWREKWQTKMESFEFFAGRQGGWGVFNCTDLEFSQAMMEYPVAPFQSISVHPTVDGDEALVRVIETTKQMLAAMSG